MDIRPVLYIIGLFLCIISFSMVLPLLADIYWHNADWKAFFLSIIITSFFGGSLVLSNSGQPFNMNTKQAIVLIFLTWLSLAAFSSLPFTLSKLDMSFTDAFFESVSGITTTGSTVIIGLDTAPPGILLWRAILQWLGGIGIIIMAMSIMPFLKVGGMQIFQAELSENEKAIPRTAQLASSIGSIYLALTILCALAYMASGLEIFDALAHAFTTISTGGFSTYDASIGHFKSNSTELVAITFMLLGGLPFVLYLKAIRGNLKPLLKDSQVHTFLGIVALVSTVIIINLTLFQDAPFSTTVIEVIFNVVSLITGTGFASADYGQWGTLPVALLFFIMAVGGCAGSTSCGIKIFRFQVFYAVTMVQIKKLIHPNGTYNATYNGKPIPEDVPISVMSFLFLFALSFAIVAMALSFVGLDFMTAMSGALTSIANVGPGLGDIIGPAGNFAPLPDSAKWILSTSMLLGRLEILTVLVMLHPNFWKK